MKDDEDRIQITKIGYRQIGVVAQFALIANVQKIFASRPERRAT
jgi:hypothetical protein